MPLRSSCGRRLASPRQRGFTVFELLICLGLVTLTAALAIPMYFERGEVTLEHAALQLCNDLRSTQNRAAYQGTETVLHFDEDGCGYAALDGSAGSKGRRKLRPVARRYTRDGVFEGVRVLSVVLENGGRSVRYQALGNAVDAGEIVLGFRGETRTIRIERGAGQLSIFDSSSGWSDNGL